MKHSLLCALTAVTFAACGGGNKPAANTAGSATETTAAACSAEECAAVAEPPISPMACGEGHESEIGTVCQRSTSGACEKVLQCKGATATAPAP
jgi:hypothetical protein